MSHYFKLTYLKDKINQIKMNFDNEVFNIQDMKDIKLYTDMIETILNLCDSEYLKDKLKLFIHDCPQYSIWESMLVELFEKLTIVNKSYPETGGSIVGILFNKNNLSTTNRSELVDNLKELHEIANQVLRLAISSLYLHDIVKDDVFLYQNSVNTELTSIATMLQDHDDRIEVTPNHTIGTGQSSAKRADTSGEKTSNFNSNIINNKFNEVKDKFIKSNLFPENPILLDQAHSTHETLSSNDEKLILAEFNFLLRRDAVFSQALTATITGIASKIIPNMYNLNFWQQIIQYGILLNFETYVSTWRTEQAMLEDHSVAILTDIPQNCKVKFINLDASKKYYSSSYQNLRDSKKQEIFEQQLKSGSKNDLSSDETPVMSPEPIRSDSLSAAEKSENNRRNFDLENLNNNILNNSNQAMSDFYTPFITGSSQDLKINIMVPEQVFALVLENLNYNLSEIEVDINTVFFNTGINEEQALADKLNQIYPQDIVNYESCKRLTDYYRKVNNDDWTSKKSGILLLELIEHCQLNPIKNKDVKIQELAQKICRELNAVRYIQCKSAKDRTSMGVSLEQIRIMKDEFELDESLASENLETIRKNGMGLIRCYKNTTKFFYAFNAVQLSTFPRDYKPPKGTYGVGLAS